MYTKILERTINKLKGDDFEEEFEPELKVNIEAFIQDNYINDVGERLSYYRKLAQASSEKEIDNIECEIMDRFGNLPKKLIVLIKIAKLKLAAKKLKIREVFIDQRGVSLKVDDNFIASREKLIEALKSKDFSYSNDGKIKLNIREKDPFKKLDIAKKMLLNISEYAT